MAHDGDACASSAHFHTTDHRRAADTRGDVCPTFDRQLIETTDAV
jgi:hypothetical protein